jgi:hypothetical protein
LLDDARVEVQDQPAAWLVRLDVEEAAFRISVPRDALEWFIDAMKAGNDDTVWSDWVDYYDIDGSRTTADLRSEMADDLQLCVSRLLDAHLRVVNDGRRTHIEWRRGYADWGRLSSADLLA